MVCFCPLLPPSHANSLLLREASVDPLLENLPEDDDMFAYDLDDLDEAELDMLAADLDLSEETSSEASSALRAELAKIRAEREAAEQAQREADAANAAPDVSAAGAAPISRSWLDDGPFPFPCPLSTDPLPEPNSAADIVRRYVRQ
jgi:hypothetical protein